MNERESGVRIAYLDCFSGISGDMFVAAFLDSGVKLDELRELLERLPIGGWKIRTERTRRGSLAGTRFIVETEESAGPHARTKHGHAGERRLPEVLDVIRASSLPESVKETSSRVFSELAAAEAWVHGVGPGEVHFHEVGAIDSVIDIVGAACCLHLSGVEKLYASTLSVGKGEIESRHGTLPLPAPAAAKLLAGKSVRMLDVEAELVTPTGAALVSALASQDAVPSPFRLDSVGHGAGTNQLAALPNILRVFVGACEAAPAELGWVDVIETTIDDMNPQIYSFLQERLFQMGALEVFLTPVQMKKGRPGSLLTVLSEPGLARKLAREVFEQTTTLGLRVTTQQRMELSRSLEEVETRFGRIRVKVPVGFPDRASPEYEDCARVAREAGVPVAVVLDAARTAWR
ncbi:MAG: nickel pincer cofactor biosynthesis protein LarC, partial [Candidatus Eisenbacteria bacterium]|nr:nickel pincer cofactor biosynthesis protein LarC [Candidatus Eisenbacteria bacterium]